MRLETGRGLPTATGPVPSLVPCPCPPRLPTHAFMLLPLPLSTIYGVFWAFCFSWSKATVPRGVSLELIFFRSCRRRASQHRAGVGPRPPATPAPAGAEAAHVSTGHLPPPRPASSSAALSSSCPSLSRGSGGTAAGKPGTRAGPVLEAPVPGAQGRVGTQPTPCWAKGWWEGARRRAATLAPSGGSPEPGRRVPGLDVLQWGHSGPRVAPAHGG